MAKGRLGYHLYRWHAWVGLISGLFLIVICVTGSVAVFRPELERAVDWGDYDFNVEANGRQPVSLEQAIATAEAAYPGSRATIARLPAHGESWQSHGETYNIRLNRGKGRKNLQVLVDPYDNKVVASMVPNTGWGDWLRQLHVRFLYGSYWGRWIVGVFGLTLVFSTVSGLLIFARFNANSWKLKFRRGRGLRIATADLHKIIGLSTVAFNLMFGVTGAVVGLEGLYRKYVDIPRDPVPRLERLAELPPGIINQSMARVGDLMPGARAASVTLSYRRTGMINVHVYHPTRHLLKENASSVLFNARTGDVVRVNDARNASAAGRFYYAMEPLHFGRLAGAMWVKLLWGLMGLSGGFLSITGFMIYVLRKRKPRPAKAAAPAPYSPPMTPQPAWERQA